MEASDLERLIRVNTLGTAYVTRALLPGMKAAGGGRILFTSSMCGLVGHNNLRCDHVVITSSLCRVEFSFPLPLHHASPIPLLVVLDGCCTCAFPIELKYMLWRAPR